MQVIILFMGSRQKIRFTYFLIEIETIFCFKGSRIFFEFNRKLHTFIFSTLFHGGIVEPRPSKDSPLLWAKMNKLQYLYDAIVHPQDTIDRDTTDIDTVDRDTTGYRTIVEVHSLFPSTATSWAESLATSKFLPFCYVTIKLKCSTKIIFFSS